MNPLTHRPTPPRLALRTLAVQSCLGLGVALALPAWAETEAQPAAAPTEASAHPVPPTAEAAETPRAASLPIGAATQALFDQQRQASAQRRAPGIPGPIAVESWDRYVRSYKSEIPPQFSRQLKESGRQ